MERALDGLASAAADDLVKRLRRALVGRGLVIVTSSLPTHIDQPPFEVVVRFESSGAAAVEDRRARLMKKVKVRSVAELVGFLSARHG